MADETNPKAGAKPAAPTRAERIAAIAAERSALCNGALSRETLTEVATRQVDHDDAQAALAAPATPAAPAGKGGK